ncbi:hypothetical protein BLOT_010409 [Blomia tropicalis]|nr:hypothetical protein BLOT_010409 [Blomia tropicalis]
MIRSPVIGDDDDDDGAFLPNLPSKWFEKKGKSKNEQTDYVLTMDLTNQKIVNSRFPLFFGLVH